MTDIFWLQVDSDFTLRLRWVSTSENMEADALTRPETMEQSCVEQEGVIELWETWGSFDVDLMATDISVQ